MRQSRESGDRRRFFSRLGGGEEVLRQKNKKDISDELLYSTAQSFMKCAERMRVLQLSRQHGN